MVKRAARRNTRTRGVKRVGERISGYWLGLGFLFDGRRVGILVV